MSRTVTPGRAGASPAVLLALCALAPGVALAGEPSSPGGGSLLDAVRATLRLKAEIKLQEEEVVARRGLVQEARGQFDLLLLGTLGHRSDTLPLTLAMQGSLVGPSGAAVAQGGTSLTSQTTSYTFGLAQQLRWGTTILPTVELSRLSDTGIGPAVGRARVRFTVVQPLFRGRGSSAVAARERAAKLEAEASRSQLRHTLALRVAATEQAYWGWRAARDSLEILRGAERRAQALLAEELALVSGGEHPPADAKQFEANLADAEAARLEAERVDLEARQVLGVEMGVPWEAIGTLPPPTTELPRVEESAVPSGDHLARLAAESLARRQDLRAFEQQVRAAETLALGARRNLEPQLDLALDLGYAGLSEGDGAGPFVTPLGDRVSGLNVGANLSFAYPAQNNAARGVLQRRSAEVRQLQIARDELARTIASGVVVAADALRAAARAQRSAERAALAYREAVTNEQKKLRAGLSTNIDVILTQTRLTNAQLAALRARVRVAETLTRLRFTSGTLVDLTAEGGAVVLEMLTTPPL